MEDTVETTLAHLSRGDQLSLAHFRRQYMQRCNVKDIDFPSLVLLSEWSIQQWLWTVVDYLQKHNDYPAYDRIFLKILLSKLEQAVDHVSEPDIVDSFAELHAQLLNSPDDARSEDYVWIRYVPPWHPTTLSNMADGFDLLEQPHVLSASGCTGHRTWEAALHLASFLYNDPFITNVRGKVVVELGAGTGLLAMTCHCLGASHVTATDGDFESVQRLRHTVEHNEALQLTDTSQHLEKRACQQGQVACRKFRWGQSLDQLGLEHVDTILAADVTYDTASIPELVTTLRDVLGRWPHTCIIISATIRNTETFNSFVSTCNDSQMKAATINVPDERPQAGFFHSTASLIRTVQITWQSS